MVRVLHAEGCKFKSHREVLLLLCLLFFFFLIFILFIFYLHNYCIQSCIYISHGFYSRKCYNSIYKNLLFSSSLHFKQCPQPLCHSQSLWRWSTCIGDYQVEMNDEVFTKWLNQKRIPNLPAHTVGKIDSGH
jgi:hypothetical protein